jgi:hypothetical protein
MADYSASVAEAASIVDSKQSPEDIPEESLIQISSRPPSVILAQVHEDSNSSQTLVQQLQKLNLTPDQLQYLSQLNNANNAQSVGSGDQPQQSLQQ